MNYENIFDQSYERIKNLCINGETFFGAFYRNFVALSPTAADHFASVDMDKQITMMEKSFYSLFIFYATQNANDYLKAIARRHSELDLGISLELFDAWIEALITTVKQFDANFTDEVALSWRVVLSPGMTYMKYRYNRLP